MRRIKIPFAKPGTTIAVRAMYQYPVRALPPVPAEEVSAATVADNIRRYNDAVAEMARQAAAKAMSEALAEQAAAALVIEEMLNSTPLATANFDMGSVMDTLDLHTVQVCQYNGVQSGAHYCFTGHNMGDIWVPAIEFEEPLTGGEEADVTYLRTDDSETRYGTSYSVGYANLPKVRKLIETGSPVIIEHIAFVRGEAIGYGFGLLVVSELPNTKIVGPQRITKLVQRNGTVHLRARPYNSTY